VLLSHPCAAAAPVGGVAQQRRSRRRARARAHPLSQPCLPTGTSAPHPDPLAGSGIIYCVSKKECQRVAGVLAGEGVSAGFYHAAVTPAKRRAVQTAWQAGASPSSHYRHCCVALRPSQHASPGHTRRLVTACRRAGGDRGHHRVRHGHRHAERALRRALLHARQRAGVLPGACSVLHDARCLQPSPNGSPQRCRRSGARGATGSPPSASSSTPRVTSTRCATWRASGRAAGSATTTAWTR